MIHWQTFGNRENDGVVDSGESEKHIARALKSYGKTVIYLSVLTGLWNNKDARSSHYGSTINT